MMLSIRNILFKENRVCPWWLAYTFDNPFRRLFHNPDQILGDYVKPGQTVLDIGCGLGYFTLAMARMVGEKGKVIAVDLQPQMLKRLRRRAERAGLQLRIQPHLSQRDLLGVKEPVDFILAFWMVHEVDNQTSFFQEVHGLMKPEARFLVVEPKFHVTDSAFQKTVAIAHQTGLVSLDAPQVRFSRAINFVNE